MTKGMRISKGPEEEILQILIVMVIVLQCLLVYVDQKWIVCALYVNKLDFGECNVGLCCLDNVLPHFRILLDLIPVQFLSPFL